MVTSRSLNRSWNLLSKLHMRRNHAILILRIVRPFSHYHLQLTMECIELCPFDSHPISLTYETRCTYEIIRGGFKWVALLSKVLEIFLLFMFRETIFLDNDCFSEKSQSQGEKSGLFLFNPKKPGKIRKIKVSKIQSDLGSI